MFRALKILNLEIIDFRYSRVLTYLFLQRIRWIAVSLMACSEGPEFDPRLRLGVCLTSL